MGGGAISSNPSNEVEAILQQRRAELASAPGLAGLMRNKKSAAIGFFASLGGLVYGWNQGLFGQILAQQAFATASGIKGITNPTLSSFVTAILELGAWIGVLANGIIADALGRKNCVIVAVFFFSLGVVIQACTHGGDDVFIWVGRFITGIGIGSLSMIVPLYNAELAPPEIRGALVAVQQLAITTGITLAFWFTFGTSYIGGTGAGQSQAAWLLPVCIQLVPALILGIGILFMPQSPRWLMDQGREQECLSTIAGLRQMNPESELVQMEYLELKAQKVFEDRIRQMDHPHLLDGSLSSRIKLGAAGYASLFTNRSNFKRTMVAVMTMVFQQWTGVNFILYYAPFIFKDLGLGGNTNSLLSSGVTDIVMMLMTIPAVLYSDKIGRKPLLISGAIIMGLCHFIVAGIIAQCRDQWAVGEAKAAGWVACVFIWIFAGAFGYSWGPCAWIVVAECFPLGLRAKGVSIGASSNWLNNFAVGMSTLDFVTAAPFGAYIFLGACCILGTLYVYFFVPETKNKTLDEIAAEFGDNTGRTQLEAKMLHEAYAEVGLLALADVPKDATVLETNVAYASAPGGASSPGHESAGSDEKLA